MADLRHRKRILRWLWTAAFASAWLALFADSMGRKEDDDHDRF